MLYSSSFDALKKCLVGVQKYIQVNIVTPPASQPHDIILTQATDESEASEEEIEQQLRKTDRI